MIIQELLTQLMMSAIWIFGAGWPMLPNQWLQ
jgi:hypothetical protein